MIMMITPNGAWGRRHVGFRGIMLFTMQLLGIAAAAAATATVLSRRSNKLQPPGKVRVTYWAGRGKCEPLRCILAAGGINFENNFFTAATGKQELTKLRAERCLAYDQVPLVEMDGLHLVQGSATATYLGTRLGLLPSDPRESYIAQHVFASSQDAQACMVGFPFADYPAVPTPATYERVLAECRGPRGLIGRYAGKWEAMLQSGGPFFIGDVGVFEAIDYFKDVFGVDMFDQCFAPFPNLLKHYAATKELGRLAEHCDVDRTSYATWDAGAKKHTNWQKYATDVRETLA